MKTTFTEKKTTHCLTIKKLIITFRRDPNGTGFIKTPEKENARPLKTDHLT